MEKESEEKEMGTVLRSGRRLPERPAPTLPARASSKKAADDSEPLVDESNRIDDRDDNLIDFDDKLSDNDENLGKNLVKAFSREQIESVCMPNPVQDVLEECNEEIGQKKQKKIGVIPDVGYAKERDCIGLVNNALSNGDVQCRNEFDQELIHAHDCMQKENAQSIDEEIEAIIEGVVNRAIDQLNLTNVAKCEETGIVGMGDNKNLSKNPIPSDQKPNQNIPKMKAPLYDGTCSWADYLIQFELVAETNGWSEDTMAMCLGASLRGTAQRILGDLSSVARRHYPSLVACLNQRFGSENQSEMFRVQLDSKVKRPDESLPELAHEIRRLVKLSYPTAPRDMLEILSKKYFLWAIPDSDLRIHVFKSNPETLNKAVKAAVELEAYMEADKLRSGKYQKSVRKVNQSKMGEGQIMCNQVSKQVKVMLEPVTRLLEVLVLNSPKIAVNYANRTFQGKYGKRESKRWHDKRRNIVKCFNCGRPGHFARDCTSTHRYCQGKDSNNSMGPNERN